MCTVHAGVSVYFKIFGLQQRNPLNHKLSAKTKLK